MYKIKNHNTHASVRFCFGLRYSERAILTQKSYPKQTNPSQKTSLNVNPPTTPFAPGPNIKLWNL